MKLLGVFRTESLTGEKRHEPATRLPCRLASQRSDRGPLGQLRLLWQGAGERDDGGGHTTISGEWIIGVSVVGSVGPWGLLSKQGARPGDRLLLSKPVGCGVLLRAHRQLQASDADLTEALDVMATSNRVAAAQAGEAGVHASTDVTGFGLLGSLAEMLDGDLGAILRLEQ